MANPTDIQGSASSPEQLRPFVATPEKISQYLPLKAEEIKAEMISIEGRKMLVDQLLEQQDAIKKDHPDFQPEKVRDQLDMGAELLQAEDLYMKSIQAPEKKNLFRRVWDAITWLPRKHPIVTALLIAVALGAGASYMGWIPGIDWGGMWSRLQNMMPWNWGKGAAEALPMGEAAGEAIKDIAPETGNLVDIVTRDRHIFYGGKEYTPDAFGEIIDKLRTANPAAEFRLRPLPSSRVTIEQGVRELLESKGIENFRDLSPRGMIDWKIP